MVLVHFVILISAKNNHMQFGLQLLLSHFNYFYFARVQEK